MIKSQPLGPPTSKPIKRVWLVLAGVVLLAVAIPMGCRVMKDRRNAGALRAVLAEARKVGIPTTAAEYAATFKPAAPEDNAAPFYRSLEGMKVDGTAVSKATSTLLTKRTPDTLRAAKTLLRTNANYLRVINQAAALPRCWFDRDWTDGGGVLLPEYQYMKNGVRLLGLRGSVAASEGRVSDALADLRRMIAIYNHAGEEGHAFGAVVARSLYYLSLRVAATWSFWNPDAAAYRKAVIGVLARRPQLNLQREQKGELFEILTIIDMCSTAEGRSRMGLRPDQISKLENVAPILADQGRARVTLIKEHIAYWTALGKEPPDLKAAAESAERRDTAMVAFPTAADIYLKLVVPNDHEATKRDTQARNQLNTALGRAFASPKIPRSIKTSDLLSPYDRKPITYIFDGKRLTIKVSGNEFDLEIPPTEAR